MDRQDVISQLALRERINFEVKKAENSIPKSVW